jgi:hypothetical protein
MHTIGIEIACREAENVDSGKDFTEEISPGGRYDL